MSARFCPSCGSEHYGRVPCGLTWIERLRSTDVHASVHTTRTKRNYYDRGAVAQTFGADARERMYEDTGGVGYVRKVGDRFFHRDRTSGEVVPLDERKADALLGPEL